MAQDITIVDTASSTSWLVSSAKKRTVAEILDTIGAGTLVDPEGLLMVKDEILEVSGTYRWTGVKGAFNGKKCFQINCGRQANLNIDGWTRNECISRSGRIVVSSSLSVVFFMLNVFKSSLVNTLDLPLCLCYD